MGRSGGGNESIDMYLAKGFLSGSSKFSLRNPSILQLQFVKDFEDTTRTSSSNGSEEYLTVCHNLADIMETEDREDRLKKMESDIAEIKNAILRGKVVDLSKVKKIDEYLTE